MPSPHVTSPFYPPPPISHPTKPHSDCTTNHCLTFGAPPSPPTPSSPPRPNSRFLSLTTATDPIPRADTPHINDLLKLLVTPMPAVPGTTAWPLSPRDLVNAGTVLVMNVPGMGKRRFWLVAERGLEGVVLERVEGHRMRGHLGALGGVVFEV